MAVYIAFAAFFLDCIIGDPKSKFHPVVLLGNCISFIEKCLLREEHPPWRKMYRGGILVIAVLSATYLFTQRFITEASAYHEWLGWAANALVLSFVISPRSLAEAGVEIRNALLRGDLAHARFKVGWIVGRDTEKLDVPEVTRATVETIAENIVDGIISPLFYFFIGGAPLAALYRAVNTMDSMLGYKNDRYFYFGKAAARTDDAFNFVPARVTAILLIIAAYLLRFDSRNAARVMLRDAEKHPSPNSGFSEATVAGALNVRLGGFNEYFGVSSFRAYMGDPKEELSPVHITRAIYLMYGATLELLCIVAAGFALGGFLR